MGDFLGDLETFLGDLRGDFLGDFLGDLETFLGDLRGDFLGDFLGDLRETFLREDFFKSQTTLQTDFLETFLGDLRVDFLGDLLLILFAIIYL